jgi:hypothetical protein
MKYQRSYVLYQSFWETKLGAALSGRSDNRFLTAILVGFVGKIATFITALIIYGLAWEFFRADASLSFSGSGQSLSAELLFKALIFAPIAESAIVLAMVWLLSKNFKASTIITVVTSGAIHVPLHGLSVASLSVFPLFALHTLIQLRWMGREKARDGYCVIVTAHAITNAIAIVAMILL